MTKRFLTSLTAGFVAAALCAPALADGKKGTAVIKGKVVFEGTAPKTAALPFSGSDAEVCKKENSGKPQPDQSKLVYAADGNAVPYVFVSISKGLSEKYDAPKDPIVIDQKGCKYHPHVQGMVAGQPMEIRNSDPLSHNIHALPKKNKEFNFLQSTQGAKEVKTGSDTFTKPEAVKVKCDVHSWMSCYIHVMEHPFFDVTKSHEEDGGNKALRGTFEIKEVPAGKYEIQFWHESFGVVTQEVEVKDGETKEIEVKIGGKKAQAPEVREVIVASAEADAPKSCCAGKKVETKVQDAPVPTK